MKRLIWTISVAYAGIFLAGRSAPLHWEWIMWGGLFGAAIGFGFGSIFSTKNTRWAILYWALTFMTIGSIGGLEEPIDALRLIRLAAYGAAIGTIVGLVIHLSQRSRSTHTNE